MINLVCLKSSDRMLIWTVFLSLWLPKLGALNESSSMYVKKIGLAGLLNFQKAFTEIEDNEE